MLCRLFAGSDVLIPDPGVCANRNFQVLMHYGERTALLCLHCHWDLAVLSFQSSCSLRRFWLCLEWVSSLVLCVCNSFLTWAGLLMQQKLHSLIAGSCWGLAPSRRVFHENWSCSSSRHPQHCSAVLGAGSHWSLAFYFLS